ncbi:TPA: hypothetical protein DCX16_05615 [bacterium]|nr:hypothetical protein [bacterium]
MELIVYEEDKPKVLSNLRDGRIDYADLTSQTFVDKFFAFLLEAKFMRLKPEPTYHNYPYLIRSGTIFRKAQIQYRHS